MKLPVKPKKPSRNDPKPSKTIIQSFILGVNTLTGEPVLLPEYNEHREYLDINFRDGTSFTLLEKVSRLIGTNFIVRDSVDYDGYYTETVIEQTVPNPNYDIELAVYNNRHQKYKQDLAQYEKDMKAYKVYQAEQKIVKQNKHIKKLEEELQKLKS